MATFAHLDFEEQLASDRFGQKLQRDLAIQQATPDLSSYLKDSFLAEYDRCCQIDSKREEYLASRQSRLSEVRESAIVQNKLLGSLCAKLDRFEGIHTKKANHITKAHLNRKLLTTDLLRVNSSNLPNQESLIIQKQQQVERLQENLADLLEDKHEGQVLNSLKVREQIKHMIAEICCNLQTAQNFVTQNTRAVLKLEEMRRRNIEKQEELGKVCREKKLTEKFKNANSFLLNI